MHFTVFLWGFTSVLGVLIVLSSLEVVFYRTLIASVALIGIVVFYKENTLKFPNRKQLFQLLGVGALMAFHWILFFAAAKISTVSICLAGMATCSLFTSLLEPLMTKSKIKPVEVLLSFSVFFGLYTIFRFEFDHFWGIVLAISAAFIAALFTVINAKLVKKISPIVLTMYEMIGACLACLFFLPAYYFFPELSETGVLRLIPNLEEILYLLILGLVCTVYTYYTSAELLKRVSAFNMNLAVNMEPVYGIILAILVFGEKEKMSNGFYLGTIIILVSVIIYPFIINKKKEIKTQDC